MELETFDMDHRTFESRNAGDSKLYVRFFSDILPDPDASAATGIRKFRDAVMIQIMVPGDKRNIVIREAREEDKQRFPEIYRRFEEGAGEALDGFPLSQWPMATRAMVEELKYLGFITVEHVANATDQACGKHPGLRELKRRAEAWLKAQRDAAPIEQMSAQLEKLQQTNAALEAQMAELMKRVSAPK